MKNHILIFKQENFTKVQQNKQYNIIMSKETLDRLLNKWISRKLLVFLVACLGLFMSNITSGDWVIVATAYIGIQGFTDIVAKLKT